MAMARRLPYASPKSVFRVVLEILEADSDTVFTQRSLQANGIQQYRQTLTLLRFLDLLSAAGRLKPDVLENAYDAGLLKKLLLGRLRSGCLDAGCESEQLSFLDGGKILGRNDLDKQLRGLPPIAKQKTAEMRSSMFSCLRTLYQILCQSHDEHWHNWLKKEWNAMQRIQHDESGAPSGQAAVESTSFRKKQEVPQAFGSLPESGNTLGVQTVWRLPQTEQLEGSCELERITIGFTDEDDPIHAYVSFDIPPNREYLKRLGKSILQAAQNFDQGVQSKRGEAGQ